MAKLEDLTNGSVVHGLLSGEPVTVVSTKWYGSSSVEVIGTTFAMNFLITTKL